MHPTGPHPESQQRLAVLQHHFPFVECGPATVEHAVRRFDPELLLVSCGFDAHAEDPLADLELTTGCFRELAARTTQLAPRVAAVLEGGYNLRTLPWLVEAALEGFDGAA